MQKIDVDEVKKVKEILNNSFGHADIYEEGSVAACEWYFCEETEEIVFSYGYLGAGDFEQTWKVDFTDPVASLKKIKENLEFDYSDEVLKEFYDEYNSDYRDKGKYYSEQGYYVEESDYYDFFENVEYCDFAVYSPDGRIFGWRDESDSHGPIFDELSEDEIKSTLNLEKLDDLFIEFDAGEKPGYCVKKTDETGEIYYSEPRDLSEAFKQDIYIDNDGKLLILGDPSYMEILEDEEKFNEISVEEIKSRDELEESDELVVSFRYGTSVPYTYRRYPEDDPVGDGLCSLGRFMSLTMENDLSRVIYTIENTLD